MVEVKDGKWVPSANQARVNNTPARGARMGAGTIGGRGHPRHLVLLGLRPGIQNKVVGTPVAR